MEVMTIFFSGHSYKYELEGVAKLFLPLVRFTHIYDKVDNIPNSIVTRRKSGKQKSYLWVYVTINGKIARGSASIGNSNPNYQNECERLLCILLYKALQKLTDVTPKWGILTGIRPVSIVQKKLLAGNTKTEIEQELRTQYLVSSEKLALCFKTAQVQLPILKSLDKKSYSLYVSIPFCYSRCSYCSFVSSAIDTKKSKQRIGEYVSLLCKELEYTAEKAKRLGLTLDTIYIGGGTPTALEAGELEQITNAISANFPVESCREYTIEAGRADTITREKLIVIKKAGATRISINPQTFNDAVLCAIGRKHSANDVVDCYNLARELGFNNINMDLIAGLPNDTLESFKQSIDKAVLLSPENITVHTLSIKRASTLFEQGEDALCFIKENQNADMCDYANQTLGKATYQPYYLYRQKNNIGNLENVGYSKPTFESIYNVYIMDEIQTILACGAGGVTKLIGGAGNPIERSFNYKYHFEYIDMFDEIIRRKEALSFG